MSTCLPLSALERVFLPFLIALIILSVGGLILAIIGWFSALTLLTLLGIAVTGSILLFQRVEGGKARGMSLTRSDAALLGLGILFTALSFPGHENMAGGFDTGNHGIHVNVGIHIAQSSTVAVSSPALREVDPLLLTSLFTSYWQGLPPGRQLFKVFFPWGLVVDLQRAELFSQYQHLFPVYLAIAHLAGGLGALCRVNVVFGLLSLCALYLFAARCFRAKEVGLLAAALLSVNLCQIWFCRNAYAEVPTQFWIFSGLWLVAVAEDHRSIPAAFLAGVCLGLAVAVKVDSALLLLAVAGLGLYPWLVPDGRERLRGVFFPLVLGLLSAFGLVLADALSFAFSYLWALQDSLLSILAACAGIVLVFLLTRLGGDALIERITQWVEERRHQMALTFLGGVLLWFVYNYWLIGFLPFINWTGTSPRYPLRWMGWYLTSPGLLLAVVGSYLLVHRFFAERRVAIYFFLVLMATFTAALVLNPHINPVHIWAMRRFITVVIPGILLLVSLVLVQLYRRWQVERPFLARISTGGMCGYLLLFSLYTLWPFLTHVEQRGAVEQLGRIFQRVPANSVLLMENGAASFFLATPARLTWGFETYALWTDRPPVEALAAQVTRWRQQGRRVFFLASEEETYLPKDFFRDFSPVGSHTFSFPVAERSRDHRPGKVTQVSFPVKIYEVGGKHSAPSLPRIVDLGWQEFRYDPQGVELLGFWEREQTAEGADFRWTRGRGQILLRDLRLGGAEKITVSLRLASFRPPNHPSPHLRLFLNGFQVGEGEVGSGFQNFTYATEREMWKEGENELVLESDTFIAREVGLNEDSRVLGVAVDWIKIE